MLTWMLFTLLGSTILSTEALSQDDPFPAPTNLAPSEWTIPGPFPQELRSGGRTGLDTDYLGGEAVATGKAATFAGATFSPQQATATPGGVVDLVSRFGPETDLKVAYAFSSMTSTKAQTATFLFGSDDGAKVWVNGELVHTIATAGRGFVQGQDRFTAELRAGENAVVVKVENGSGGWAFALEAYDELGQAARDLRALRMTSSDLEIAPDAAPRFLLTGERFPELKWQRPEVASVLLRDLALSVRWFGPYATEMTAPTQPGRYAAYIEATTKDGLTQKWLLPFYKPRAPLPDLIPPMFMDTPPLGVPESLLNPMQPLSPQQREDIGRHAMDALVMSSFEKPSAAILWAALEEPAPNLALPPQLRSSYALHMAYMLRVKQAILGIKPKALTPPKKLATPAQTLKDGTEAEAGIAPGTVEKLREVANAWLAEDPIPFTVLIARNGVVFMEEGFGAPASMDFYPASIGKAIAGLTFARFLDQGLVELDDPVGSVLPGLPTEGPKAVTFRHCFTHTSGIEGHATFGGLHNPLLENAFWVDRLAFETPGVAHRYGGDGNNLAGKAMEALSGKTMLELLYENIQAPFDEPVTQYDLGFGSRFTARYLGKVGQMLLNEGSYGDWLFFTPETYRKLLPVRLADYYPELPDRQLTWGVGLTPMLDTPPALGPNVIGHGAASTSVWRVDLDHDLVLVIGRNGAKEWDHAVQWTNRFVEELAKGLR